MRATDTSRAGGGLVATALATAAALLASAVVAGCSDGWRIDNHTAQLLNTPEQRHSIGFSERTESLLVEVREGARGLSVRQEDDVHGFLTRFRSESISPLRISLPASNRVQSAARLSAQDVRSMAHGMGVPPHAVETTRHRDRGHHGPALELSYQRPVAIPPACGLYDEDLGVNHGRVNGPDFGCPTQRNLAVMTNNARDLMEPQIESPRSSERRSVTWSEYTKPSSGGSGGDAKAAPADSKGAPPTPKK